jgi:hypothetical protein
LLRHDSFQQLSNVTLPADYPEVALKLLTDSHVMHQFKSKKILISDVPPRITQTTNQGIVVASIGGLCAAVTMAGAVPVIRCLIATVAVKSSAAPGQAIARVCLLQSSSF